MDVAKVRNHLVHTRDILAHQLIHWLDIAKWKALATKKSLVQKANLVAQAMQRNVKERKKRDVRRKIVAKSLTNSIEINHEKDCESGPFFF